MNKIVLSSIVAVAGIAASAQAQNGYVFEMRLIPDGVAGAPNGTAGAPAYNIGDPTHVTASRVGFWLQARVAQTVNTNWGVVRASAPAGSSSTDFISVSDPTGAIALSRAQTTALPGFGRGTGYRSGGENTGNTGNTLNNGAYPLAAGNENGGLDNGGSGALMTRVYGFDSYVGSTRTPADADDPQQPWGVNGATSGASIGNPIPSNGTFSPWASVYRVWLDIGSVTTGRDVVMNASALLNGALDASPTDASGGSWAMNIAVLEGQILSASYTFHVGPVPTPGAAAVLGLGGLAAMRRRR